MQLAKPILASVNKGNEIITLIENNNIGLVSKADDIDSFNKNLSIMINSNNLRKKQGAKSLKLLNSKFTVLDYVIRQLGHSKLLENIIIATTNLEQDDVVVQYAKDNGLAYFRGEALNWEQIDMTSPDLDGGAGGCIAGGAVHV